MFREGIKCIMLGLFLTLAFLSVAHAETTSSEISVDTTPSSYGPGESITLSLSSFSANLDAVKITWFVNGKNSSSGIGQKSFTLSSGNAGSETKVVASLAFTDGIIEKTILIKPNKMVLLWEATDSHVPPFYKGKALPSPDSEIKVVAMPEVKLGSGILDPKSLIYAWKKDYSNEVEGSGYGKNFFYYINDYLEPSNLIEVTASTPSGENSATENIYISPSQPKISFYIKNASLGTLWEKELADGYFVKNGDTILAEPYFIAPKDVRRPDLNFNWFVNSDPVTVPSYKKNALPLGIQAGTSGSSVLRLDIENNYKVFQAVEKEIKLNF